MFIEINGQNEVIDIYPESINVNSIEITNIDFNIIRANGYWNCVYSSNVVTFDQSRFDANRFSLAKRHAEQTAKNAALSDLAMQKAAPTIAKIQAIPNQAALDALDIIEDVKGNP